MSNNGAQDVKKPYTVNYVRKVSWASQGVSHIKR